MTGKVDKEMTLNTKFYYAARSDDTETMQLCLRAGADIHFSSDAALRGAVENGHTEMVRYLLQLGADVHAKDDEALRFAKNHHHRKMSALLKEWVL